MTRNSITQSLKWLVPFVLILGMQGSIQPVSSNTNWSDDFSVDGAPEDWEFYAFERGDGGGGGPCVPVMNETLHTRVRNGALMSPHYIDESTYGYKFAIRSEAQHISTQVYGNWSFDWISSNEVGRTHGAIVDVVFIASSSNNLWNASGDSEEAWLQDKTFYGVGMISRTLVELGASLNSGLVGPGFTLYTVDSGVATIVDSYEFSQNIDGSHHIEIQRDEINGVQVYFDDILVLKHKSNIAFKSDRFIFSSVLGGSGIDNLVIANSTDSNEIISDDSNGNVTISSSHSTEANWQYILSGGIAGVMLMAIFGGRVKKKLLMLFNKRQIRKSQQILRNFSDIFSSSQLSYLAVLGNTKFDEEEISNRLQKDIPNEIKDYRFLMHPNRLIIMKQLYKNFNLTSVELKNSANLSWGEYAGHINALEDKGFISQHDNFLDGLRVKMVYLEEPGRIEYENLIQLLKEFLEDATNDFFDLEPKNFLYPKNWDNSTS